MSIFQVPDPESQKHPIPALGSKRAQVEGISEMAVALEQGEAFVQRVASLHAAGRADYAQDLLHAHDLLDDAIHQFSTVRFENDNAWRSALEDIRIDNDEVLRRLNEVQARMDAELAMPTLEVSYLRRAFNEATFSAAFATGALKAPELRATPPKSIDELANERGVVNSTASETDYWLGQVGLFFIGAFYGLSIAARQEWVRIEAPLRTPGMTLAVAAVGIFLFHFMKKNVESSFQAGAEVWFFEKKWGGRFAIAIAVGMCFLAIDTVMTRTGLLSVETLTNLANGGETSEHKLMNWALSFSVGAAFLYYAVREGWNRGIQAALEQRTLGTRDAQQRISTESHAARIEAYLESPDTKRAAGLEQLASTIKAHLDRAQAEVVSIKQAHEPILREIISNLQHPSVRFNPELQALRQQLLERSDNAYAVVQKMAQGRNTNFVSTGQHVPPLGLSAPVRVHSKFRFLKQITAWLGRLFGSNPQANNQRIAP